MMKKPGRVILLVDDDSHVRRAMRRILAKRLLNFTLIEAGDGEKALQTVVERRGQIDLIICDVEMPVMSGDEFLRRVIVDYPYLQAKVLVTGNVDGRSFFRRWSFSRIKKPFIADDLLRAINELLDES